MLASSREEVVVRRDMEKVPTPWARPFQDSDAERKYFSTGTNTLLFHTGQCSGFISDSGITLGAAKGNICGATC